MKTQVLTMSQANRSVSPTTDVYNIPASNPSPQTSSKSASKQQPNTKAP